MKNLVYLSLAVSIMACSKGEEEQPPVAPAIAVKCYQLQRKSAWKNSVLYNSGDKMLQFDSINRVVNISGSSNDFYANGTYAFRFFDTTTYFYHPVLKQMIPRQLSLLYIKNFPSEQIRVYEHNSKKLSVVDEGSLGIADDERTYEFVFK